MPIQPIKVLQLSPSQVVQRGIKNWPTWEKDISEFPWHYDTAEECLLIAGEAIVAPHGGEPVTLRAGDFITFPAGLHCTWKITKKILKHYNFL